MLFIALISFIMYEYILMLIFWCSHCGSTIFVGAGFSYALRLIRVDRPHVPMWSQMLTAYSARGQLMCHEVCITMKIDEDSIGSTWAFDAPAQNFVNEISAPLRGLIM
jgi:hypothetical protein